MNYTTLVRKKVFEAISAFAESSYVNTTFGFVRLKPHIVLAVLITVAGAGYYFLSAETTEKTTYSLGAVSRSTLVVSVSGSGQVSASKQVDLKSKVSGDVVSVSVAPGQPVRSGQLLLSLDSRDAQKTVRDARTNVSSAQLSLDKISSPTDTLTIAQAENKIAASEDTLKKSYDDGFNAISNAFLDLPAVMSGLEDVLYGTSLSYTKTQSNIDAYAALLPYDEVNLEVFKSDAALKYAKSRKQYDAAFAHYRTLTRSIEDSENEKEIWATYELTKDIADAVKSTYDYISFVKDRLQTRSATIPSILATHESSLNAYTAKTNTHLSSLLNIRNTITTTKRNLSEQIATLEDLKLGSDTIDIASAKLSLEQRKNALQDALEKLSDYSVRAPFSGTVASLDVQRGQTVSSGSVFGILITKEKIAEISLNEVDIAKVKVGQKVTLGFDAVEDLTISGTVRSIDTIGSVSQGVVSYNVSIVFDTQDERIRPGMSVSANIITQSKVDVLLVPVAAVKQDSSGSYVEIPPSLSEEQKNTLNGLTFDLPLEKKYIETGLTDDVSIEILSGLDEEQLIIIRTIKQTVSSTANTAPSLFGTMRPPGGMGGSSTRSGSGQR